jgi:hypothetical protein
VKQVLQLLFLTLVLAGCGEGATDHDTQYSTPDIAGLIYSIEGKTILVVEGIEDVNISQEEWHGKPAIRYEITTDTIIESEEGEKLTFVDLHIGQKVQVWSYGPIMESYPMQTKAKKIILFNY